MNTRVPISNKKLKLSNVVPKKARANCSQEFQATHYNSPFKSFVTNGASCVRRKCSFTDFAYDLSREELQFVGKFKSPMKDVPVNEKQVLLDGQREAYLALRYEHTPDIKYNYPEATSWRIGWLHNQQTRESNKVLEPTVTG